MLPTRFANDALIDLELVIVCDRVLEEPVVLAKFGELPAGMFGED